MIFKLTLTISGVKLRPEEVFSHLTGTYTIASSCNAGELVNVGRHQIVANTGSISFWNPQKFGIQHDLESYELWFVEFIENNFSYLLLSGLEDIDIYTEVYYDGGQCNFEMFSKNSLARLSKFNVSLPVSVYQMTESELIDLVSESPFKSN